jgi:hypothetical protein
VKKVFLLVLLLCAFFPWPATSLAVVNPGTTLGVELYSDQLYVARNLSFDVGADGQYFDQDKIKRYVTMLGGFGYHCHHGCAWIYLEPLGGSRGIFEPDKWNYTAGLRGGWFLPEHALFGETRLRFHMMAHKPVILEGRFEQSAWWYKVGGLGLVLHTWNTNHFMVGPQITLRFDNIFVSGAYTFGRDIDRLNYPAETRAEIRLVYRDQFPKTVPMDEHH